MNVKKCDWCDRVQRDDEDPSYEWFSISDGLDNNRAADAELCSKDCITAWVDWRAEVRVEIDKQMEDAVS